MYMWKVSPLSSSVKVLFVSLEDMTKMFVLKNENELRTFLIKRKFTFGNFENKGLGAGHVCNRA